MVKRGGGGGCIMCDVTFRNPGPSTSFLYNSTQKCPKFTSLNVSHHYHSGSKRRVSLKRIRRRTRIDCTICGKVFSNRQGLFRHMNTHEATATQIFPCVVCGRNFNRTDSLKRHCRLIHGVQLGLYNLQPFAAT